MVFFASSRMSETRTAIWLALIVYIGTLVSTSKAATVKLDASASASVSAAVFDNGRSDNLAVYWGQDSAGNQKTLSYYCADDTINAIPLAFLYIFRGTGGAPVIDFANTCNQWDNSVFPGTALADCSFLASDIKTCQAKGKIITISLGGGTGQVGFSSDSQATTFATSIWNMFLGGQSSTRPFGDAVLDGIDLDIESGSPAHYAAFVNQIHTLAKGASKKYYVTAAPQCPYPDASIGAALNNASFDAVYVQFYNNYCELSEPSDFNFATWDNWAKKTSPNKNVKVYIGAPGSANAAGEGYVGINTLISMAQSAQKQYSSFGGVMLWDASEAYSNNRYDAKIKAALTNGAAALSKTQAPAASTHAPEAASTHTLATPPAVPGTHTLTTLPVPTLATPPAAPEPTSTFVVHKPQTGPKQK